MGFGRCLLQSTTNPKPSDAPRKRKPRVHCDSFYWDISSVLAKTFCLATFFVAESPRRIVSYISRKPEVSPASSRSSPSLSGQTPPLIGPRLFIPAKTVLYLFKMGLSNVRLRTSLLRPPRRTRFRKVFLHRPNIRSTVRHH